MTGRRRVHQLTAIAAAAMLLALTANARAQSGEPPPERWEPAVLPVLNYDSDLGFGFGAIGVLARFEPGYEPYRLRLQALLQASVAVDAAGDAHVPLHDDYVRMDLPGLLDDRLRIQAELGFNKLATTGYYGIGPRSSVATFSDEELETSEAARRFHTYDKTTLSLDFFARFALLKLDSPGEDPRLEIYDGTHVAHVWMGRYLDSKLTADLRDRGEPGARGDALSRLLDGTTDHPLIAKSFGLVWDSRDHEFAPDTGTLTELGVRLSPGAARRLTYARVHVATRWFTPLVRSYLVLAHRLAFDALTGHPPIYELSQLGVLTSEDLGGSTTLRGVTLRRYHGRLKLLGQVELRGSFPWFTVFGERFQIGVVGFADAARLWADFASRPELDEDLDRPPFALGTGGGLRVRWADTFILRADGAYSPTDATNGVYVDIGHAF